MLGLLGAEELLEDLPERLEVELRNYLGQHLQEVQPLAKCVVRWRLI